MNLKKMAKILSLLVMGISVYALQACGDDGEDSITVLENGNMSVNGHEAVDLGLSVNWATCNVGASSPEEYGDYFAWGEITAKSSYTKYNSLTHKQEFGDISGTQYDVAHVKWGGSWRMPTKDECRELLEKCTITSTILNEIKGVLVVGPNGKSIFLPAAGYYGGKSQSYNGDPSYYWSSTPYVTSHPSEDDLRYAGGFTFYRDFGGYIDLTGGSRWVGRSVRPVSD